MDGSVCVSATDPDDETEPMGGASGTPNVIGGRGTKSITLTSLSQTTLGSIPLFVVRFLVVAAIAGVPGEAMRPRSVSLRLCV